MVSKSIRISYAGENDKRFTRSFRGISPDAIEDDIVDFIKNSPTLVDAGGYLSASLITTESISR